MAYTQLTQSQIRSLLRQRLKENFGNDVDLSEQSVFSTLLDVQAGVGADVYEPIVTEVYNSAFLETAKENDLNKVVELLGIQRRNATKATGVVVFDRPTPVPTTYNLQSGIKIQTDETNPVIFETSESTSLFLYDGFESNALTGWNGDTSYFGTSTTQVFNGSYAAEGPSASSIRHIYLQSKNFHAGKKTSFQMYQESGSITGVTFCVQDSDNYYKFVYDTVAGEMRITRVVNGTEFTLGSTSQSPVQDTYKQMIVEMSIPNESDEVTIRCTTNYGSAEVIVQESLDDAFLSGGIGLYAESGKAYWDDIRDYRTAVNINALEGGAHGNIGADALTVLPIVPAGVSTVTNPYSTGDTVYEDLNGNAYTEGRNRETDPELRTRTRNSIGEQGTSTIPAIETAVMGVNGVRSVTVFNNPTFNTVDGLPPVSIEVVVFGGDENEIAQTIFETSAGTSNKVGGVNGTATSGTATSSVTGDTFTIDYSTPTELSVSITMDLVVTDEYIGDNAVRDLIVSHIGGVQSGGTNVVGLGAGEDIVMDKLTDIIVGEDTGVEGIVSISTTPTTTTDADGLSVVAVADEEVASTNATDGSITITK